MAEPADARASKSRAFGREGSSPSFRMKSFAGELQLAERERAATNATSSNLAARLSARVAKLVKASDCKSDHRGFESRRALHVAEMEQERLDGLMNHTSPGATPGSAICEL